MLSIKINDIERKSAIDFRSLKIRNLINNRIDTCDFKIRKTTTNNYTPQLNDEVIIEKDSVKLFGGVIITIEEEVSAGNNIVYIIKCSDYSYYLKRKLVTERYETETVENIIDDIITNYTDDGFTTTNVNYERTLSSFSFNGLNVAECLDKLAKSLNAYWYVDYNKDIHFFEKNTEIAPFSLTDTSKNYIFDSLKITDDITQLRNKITVRGSTTPSTSDRVETLVCQDNNQDVYPLGYKFATKPTIEVNSVAQTVGIANLDDESSFDVMWSYQEKYIKFTSGNIPTTDDIIEVAGKIEIPIIVRTPNNASIAEFGVFEYRIDDTTIKTQSEAIKRAIAELESYSYELNEGSFETYTAGLKAGQILNISSEIRNKEIDVIIQSVDLKSVDPEANQVRYKVSFATTKTMGIIEFLQRSLRNEEIIEDAQEVILNFIQQDTETISISDEGVQDILVSSPPYLYSGTILADSYPTTNYAGTARTVDVTNDIAGQVITMSETIKINKLQFYIGKFSGKTGNVTAKIYGVDGTVGTNGKPTGSPLKVSDTIFDISTLDTSPALIDFDFDETFELESGNDYALTLEYEGSDSTAMFIGMDNSSPTHAGNAFYKIVGSLSGTSSYDCIFYLYGLEENNGIWNFASWV